LPSSDLLEDDFANLEADTRRRRPELLLTVASALLLVGNVLLILAVFLNFVGSVGGWDGSKTIWVAFGMDLVGVALLGRAFLVTAGQAEGRSRLYRLAAGSLLLLWVGLTAFWRFGLPAVMGTNIQDLFLTLITSQAGVPVRIMRYLTVVYEILSLWILSAFVFVLAHVIILMDSRLAPPHDWARGLPVYAWVLGAGVSLVATTLIAIAFVGVLWGGSLAGNFNAWVVAKMIVAPNIFISGYASSLQLGRSAARASSPLAED